MQDYEEGCDYYVERWKGEMVERSLRNRPCQTTKPCHPGL